MIERLLEDHAKLRELSAELTTLLRCDTLCELAALADCRWRMARMILRHLPVEDREVYQRIEKHPASAAVAYAARSKAELDTMYHGFHAHTDAWTPDRIASDWITYRHMALGFQSACLRASNARRPSSIH